MLIKNKEKARIVKPNWVKMVRIFCAGAIVTAAGIEISTTLSEIEALGWGSAAGVIAVALAKKAALIA